jgi:hypothetical protein
MNTLSQLPTRVPIGTVTLPGADGRPQTHSVLMTPEFNRALAAFFDRAGGEINYSIGDLAVLGEMTNPAAAQIGELKQEIGMLRALVDSMASSLAAVSSMAGKVKGLELVSSEASRPTDWWRPGTIGAIAPNSGAFTVLNSGFGTLAAPSFYLGSESTTGFYRIGPNRWGFSVAGVRLVDWLSTTMRLSGVLDINSGSVAAPAIYFGGNTSSGIYQIGANQIGLSITGVKLIDCASGSVAVSGTLSATGQISSSVAPGTPPFAVASPDLVPVLYVARAAIADNANHLSIGSVFPADATDLPTAITLVNALKTAAVSGGL